MGIRGDGETPQKRFFWGGDGPSQPLGKRCWFDTPGGGGSSRLGLDPKSGKKPPNPAWCKFKLSAKKIEAQIPEFLIKEILAVLTPHFAKKNSPDFTPMLSGSAAAGGVLVPNLFQ